MENRAHAFAAGLFVLLLSLAAAVGVWWLGQSDDDVRTYIVETRRNVTGLNVQAAVRYRGIRAGKVTKIQTDPADPRVIQVHIYVDSRFTLSQSATAQLGYQGVTGLAFVQIEDDGSSSEPLKVGADGTARLTMKPGMIENLGDKAGDIVGQVSLVTARVARLLDEKNMQNLSRTLDNIATASEGMRELPRIMASLREVLSDANIKRLQQTLAHVEKTAGETAPLTGELRELVKSMTLLARQAQQLSGEAGEEVTANTLPRANALMREMATNARQLSRLLETLDNNPQMLLFGREAARPGPGESGFAVQTPSSLP
jgi:phospholipid/cholesterol/gamma-HCH transport system substrate-binding protein